MPDGADHVTFWNMVAKHFIREWRKFRGLTMAELAELIGMSHAAFARIERGDQRYNQDALERIAEVLRCGPGDLILTNPSDASDPMRALDPVARDLLRRVAEGLQHRAPASEPQGAEARLIGAVLASVVATGVGRLWRMLPDDAFTDPLLGHLYTVLAHREERGAPNDPVSLAKVLAEYEPLQLAGGVRYLADLAATGPALSQLPVLAARIFEAWAQRELAG